MKLLIITLLFFLAACSSNPPHSMPVGNATPVNSLATAEMLAHESGFIIVGPQRHEPAVRARLLKRPVNQENYATLPGGELIERIVIVPFEYGSAKFRPSAGQAFRIRQLLAVADRIELRGRTDGDHNTPANRRMAKRRAEAAKWYLIDRGMLGRLIEVNYAHGDYVADNGLADGRAKNRRVELEFYIDDFAFVKKNGCTTERVSTDMGCGL